VFFPWQVSSGSVQFLQVRDRAYQSGALYIFQFTLSLVSWDRIHNTSFTFWLINGPYKLERDITGG